MRRSNEPRIYGPYQHGDTWRLHYVRRGPDGKRTTEYTTHETRASADLELAGAHDEAKGITVKTAADALTAQMRAAGLAASTIETNEYRLAHFFALPKNNDRPVRWLSKRGDEMYTAAQVERSADTHQAELALAKQVGALCVKKRWLKANPFADVEPIGKKTHGSTKPRLRVDESRKLREYCLAEPGDQRRVITLAYLLLGARASELVKRDVRDLDDNGSLLWISRTKTVKGARRLAIPGELRDALIALVDGKKQTDPIFTKDNGTRATRRWAAYHVPAVCAEAKVPPLSPQAMRRTHSDLADEAGVSAIHIAAHLGQTSPAVTQRSYRDGNTVTAAKQERAFKVIAGGQT
jgi:integrase